MIYLYYIPDETVQKLMRALPLRIWLLPRPIMTTPTWTAWQYLVQSSNLPSNLPQLKSHLLDPVQVTWEQGDVYCWPVGALTTHPMHLVSGDVISLSRP